MRYVENPVILPHHEFMHESVTHMLPIRLNTRRYVDGYTSSADASDLLEARSQETAALVFEAADLENPLAVRFANCATDADLVAFLDRFGDKAAMGLGELRANAEQVRAIVGTSVHRLMPAPNRPTFLNGLLRNVSVKPVMMHLGGAHRLVLEASSVEGFMALELAAAVEAGVTSTSCQHCAKYFLVGPHTGRRSHAKFCSDRCRVAAMRARNSAQESEA